METEMVGTLKGKLGDQLGDQLGNKLEDRTEDRTEEKVAEKVTERSTESFGKSIEKKLEKKQKLEKKTKGRVAIGKEKDEGEQQRNLVFRSAQYLFVRVTQIIEHPKSRAIAIVILILILFFAILTQSITIIQLRYQIASLNQQESLDENNNKILQQKIDQMTNDTYIQQQAEQKLGMVIPGQIPVRVIVAPPAETVNPTVLPTSEKFGIFLSDWYQFMTNVWISRLEKK